MELFLFISRVHPVKEPVESVLDGGGKTLKMIGYLICYWATLAEHHRAVASSNVPQTFAKSQLGVKQNKVTTQRRAIRTIPRSFSVTMLSGSDKTASIAASTLMFLAAVTVFNS